MGLLVYDHNNAVQYLQSNHQGVAFQELLEVFSRLPLIRFAGKSEAKASLDILQTCMNRMLNDVLEQHYGWYTQVYIPGGTDDNIDFYKAWGPQLRVWMECELGNTARADADIRKLRIVANRKLADVGVLVVPTQALANRIDSGVASFERVRKILRNDAANTAPCLVIGIDVDERRIVDVTDWGYPLKTLKGERKAGKADRDAEFDRKSELAAQLWTDYVVPSLPQASMHACHLEQVRQHGPKPATPGFQGFLEEGDDAHKVFTVQDDGTLLPTGGPVQLGLFSEQAPAVRTPGVTPQECVAEALAVIAEAAPRAPRLSPGLARALLRNNGLVPNNRPAAGVSGASTQMGLVF